MDAAHVCFYNEIKLYELFNQKKMGLITFGFSISFNKTYNPYAACYVYVFFKITLLNVMIHSERIKCM